MTTYEQIIRETAAKTGHLGVDPRHVMAWLMLEHGTLDHLGHNDFVRGVATYGEMPPADSEALAESFGL